MRDFKRCDFLIIGGGIIGLTTALALKRKFSDADILLIEKEKEYASHGSGRNSGVLHAGFYYATESLKAKFTRKGNELLRDYCLEKGLPLNKCGKLVVAKTEEDLAGLDELYRRGQSNGINLLEIDVKQVQEIEPKVRTVDRALLSPDTAVINPLQVVFSLVSDAQAMGIRCKTGTKYLNRRNGRINTSSGTIEAGYVINAAGLYADRIARDFGFARHYKILPFKGLYLYSDLPPETLRLHVYPVPDLNYPFLGVHFTIAIDGRIKIGPTAIPAFWRENYTGLSNFNLGEFMEIMFSELNLLLNSNFDFKKMALTEIKKYYRPFLVKQASYLLEGVKPENYTKWGKPGIRAQLLDTRKKKLVMDFCLEGDEKSFHVLNAVSPAFTASMAFADHICREIEKRIQ